MYINHLTVAVSRETPETLAIHEKWVHLHFYLLLVLQSQVTNAKTNSVFCCLSIYNLISEVEKQTEEFEINM